MIFSVKLWRRKKDKVSRGTQKISRGVIRMLKEIKREESIKGKMRDWVDRN